MRRIFVVIGALLLLAALAGAQSVIKYSQIVKDNQGIQIGHAVEFAHPTDSIQKATSADSVIGFVGMIEVSGSDTFALVVNSGVIDVPIETPSSSQPPHTPLTLSSTTAGVLKVASAGEKILAYTMDSVTTSSTSVRVIINPAGLQPITNDEGAVIHSQTYTATDTIGSSWTELFSDLSFTALSTTNKVQIIFNGEFDDKQTTSGGAVISVRITDGESTPKGQEKQVYLVDRDFYQKTTVSLIYSESITPGSSCKYNVEAQEPITGLTSGRTTKGYLIVVEIPR